MAIIASHVKSVKNSILVPQKMTIWISWLCRRQQVDTFYQPAVRIAMGTYRWRVHLFPANLGDISEIVQAISAVRQFGGRSSMIRQPQCRNWMHFFRITCRLCKIGREKVYVLLWEEVEYSLHDCVDEAEVILCSITD